MGVRFKDRFRVKCGASTNEGSFDLLDWPGIRVRVRVGVRVRCLVVTGEHKGVG